MARRSASARPGKPVDPLATGLSELPTAALEAMAAAGRELERIQRNLTRAGHNVVSVLLEGQGPFYEWDHYPAGDVHDATTGAQYFYHAHPPEPEFPEHGHFHCFLRLDRVGRRTCDTGRRASAPADDGSNQALIHLVAISMDHAGQPIRLFAVNRWVTGETWLEASAVSGLLERFVLTHGRPAVAVNRWTAALLQLFRPQIGNMLRQRDRRLADWQRRHPGRDARDDEALEILAQEPISIRAQIAAVNSALKGRARDVGQAPGAVQRGRNRAGPGSATAISTRPRQAKRAV